MNPKKGSSALLFQEANAGVGRCAFSVTVLISGMREMG